MTTHAVRTGGPTHGLCDRPPVRDFLDRAGVRWTVCERAFRTTRTSTPVPSLIFETSGVVRRVRTYPDDWAARSAAELEALSWHR